MEVRKGYKQTEVGVIPEDWGIKSLKEIATIITGSTPSTSVPAYYGDEYFFVSPADLGIQKYITDTNKKLTQKGFDISRKYPSGSILFTCIGSTIGKCGIAQRELTSNQQINAILPNANFFNEFVFYALDLISPKIKALAGEQAVPIINKSQFSETTIAFPTVPEQQAIAAALSDVDALLTSLDALIAKKRLIKQGAMQELLTGKKRLPGFSGEWNILELKEIVNQFIVPMRDKPKAFKGDIPWCRIEDFDGKILFGSKSNQNVDNETIKQMNLKVYPTGTLLVSCSADLGRCAIVGRPLVSNQTFIGLVFDEGKASNDYFYYYMSYHADDLNNLSSGTTISYLSREQFETFSVTVPSIKAEQTAIAEILSDMDAEIAALEARHEKTRLLKQGMMQELLTGRIRLV